MLLNFFDFVMNHPFCKFEFDSWNQGCNMCTMLCKNPHAKLTHMESSKFQGTFLDVKLNLHTKFQRANKKNVHQSSVLCILES